MQIPILGEYNKQNSVKQSEKKKEEDIKINNDRVGESAIENRNSYGKAKSMLLIGKNQ